MSEEVATKMTEIMEEVVLEVRNFAEEYDGELRKVKEMVEMMKRTGEEEDKDEDRYYMVATAREHLIVGDRGVR